MPLYNPTQDQGVIATLVSASQIGQVTAGSSSTLMTGTGIFAGSTSTVDAARTVGVNQFGRYYESDTSTVSGNNAGNRVGDACFRMDEPSILIMNLGITSVANIRFFAGNINAVGTNFANCVDADTLGSPGYGVQFSTPRGDTNFQIVSYDGTTQTTTNSGVAAAANILYSFEFRIISATSVQWKIYSSAGVLLASGTITTNLPSSTTTFFTTSACETETTAAKGVYNYSWAGIGLGYVRL